MNGDPSQPERQMPELAKASAVKVRARQSTMGKIVLDSDRWNLLHEQPSDNPEWARQVNNVRQDENEGPVQQPAELEDLVEDEEPKDQDNNQLYSPIQTRKRTMASTKVQNSDQSNSQKRTMS